MKAHYLLTLLVFLLVIGFTFAACGDDDDDDNDSGDDDNDNIDDDIDDDDDNNDNDTGDDDNDTSDDDNDTGDDDTGDDDTGDDDTGDDDTVSNCDPPCEDPKPVCDETTGVCVECLVADDCEGTEVCGDWEDESGVCLEEVLFIADRDQSTVFRVNATTGEMIDRIWDFSEADGSNEATASEPNDLLLSDDGNMYIVDFNSGKLLYGDPINGGDLTLFYSDDWMEEAVTVLEDDLYFYLLGNDHENIHVIDRKTGVLEVELGYGPCPSPNFTWPHGMLWLKQGETILVSNEYSICGGVMHVLDITDLENVEITEAFGDTFGLTSPTTATPDAAGDLYIASWSNYNMEIFDGDTFAHVENFMDEDSWGLIDPAVVFRSEFRPDGYIYGNAWRRGIVRIDAETGDVHDLWLPLISSGDKDAYLEMPIGMEWMFIPARILYPD